MRLPNDLTSALVRDSIAKTWVKKAVELGMMHGAFIDVEIGWEPYAKGVVRPVKEIDIGYNRIVFTYEGHQCESLIELERLLKLRAFT
jgi:hypothetical protein